MYLTVKMALILSQLKFVIGGLQKNIVIWTHKWHSRMDGNVGLSVGQSTTLVQTEISQQLLDEVP